MTGKTQTLESQYGQDPITVAAEIPTVALRDILGWTHVSTSDAEVEAMVRDKIGRAPIDYSPTQTDETVRAAIWLHNENRGLYRAVMSGNL